jgi:hypothetical protein
MKIKQLSWIIIILAFCANDTSAQVKLGLATGITPSHIDPGEFTISNIDDSIKYSITSTTPSWQVGIFARFQLKEVYLRGSILASFSSVYYDKDDLQNGVATISNVRDANINFNVPIEVGVRIKERFLVHAGLLFSDYVRPEEKSVLLHLPKTFTELFSDTKVGYTGGIGFDVGWQVTLGVNYTYFADVNSSIVIDNNVNYAFDYRKHYLMVNATWNFIKEGWD